MKFLIAPDSFKGPLTAVEAAAMLAEAAKAHFPNVEAVQIPMADGGEGTVEALLVAQGGKRHTLKVTGPMGSPADAAYAILDDGETAVIEMAQASGLPLVQPGQRDPLRATSLGTGQLLAHVLDQGIRRVVMGIGGSATNDGGMGFLQALGMRFYDEDGKLLDGCGEALAAVKSMDVSGLHPALAHCEITVLSDVTNPLLGENGATAIYGPQKGVTSETMPLLEAGMTQYARVLEKALGRDIASFPGAGAAGGLGAALGGVLNATMRKGIDAMLDIAHFDGQLQDCDLVISGEGAIDRQSVEFGKVVAGIARRCAQADVPLAVIVGGMGKGAEALYGLANASILTTVNAPMGLDKALSDAKLLFQSAADRLFRLLKIGYGLNQ